MSFQIYSDGSCDLPLEKAEEYNIKIIPFYVSFDSSEYKKELFEISRNEFYNRVLNEKIYPKTSLPSVSDYTEAFKESLEKGLDVICITITDTLSGSYQSACAAKQILEESYTDRKIEIVNSWLATGAASLLLIEIKKMRDNGVEFEEVLKNIDIIKKTARIMFMVGGLDYLQHGGRIGKLASLSGKILNIKPLIELKGGEINTAGMSQSRKKGLKKLADLTKNYFINNNENPKEYNFIIGTTNTPEEIDVFGKLLKEAVPDIGFIYDYFYIGATIASHTGPDTIGVCFIKKYEYS